MRTDRIDFISAYCDSWCERCAFTERCSSYAVQVATVMCDGDFRAAIELAVGRPQPANGKREPTAGERLLAKMGNVDVSDKELAEFSRLEDERQSRVEKLAVMRMAHTYMLRAIDCLNAHRDALSQSGDTVLKEAVEIVSWDVHLISVKLHRACSGRDEHQHGGGFEDDPVQNDWNGAAKVALISIERSEAAWRAIAAATPDPAAATFADALGELSRAVCREFPRAIDFVRPGFDEPWR